MERLKASTELKCELCRRNYQQPKLLPCLHSFCQTPCLERRVQDSGNEPVIICPTCGETAALPNSGVAGLPNDFITENRLQKVTKRAPNCENCKRKIGSKYCEQCLKFMCDDCTAMHQMWGDFSEHALVPADKIKPKPAAINCNEHAQKLAGLFCETCSELICTDCTMGQHKQHRYSLVNEAFPKQKDKLMHNLIPLRDSLSQVEDSLQAFENSTKEVERQRSSVKKEIDREFDRLKKLLDQRKAELLETLDLYAEKKTADLASQREGIEAMKHSMKKCLDFAENGLDIGTEGEVLRMKGTVENRIKQLNSSLDPESLQPVTELDIVWLPNGAIEKSGLEVGEVVCNSIDSENVYDDLVFNKTTPETYDTPTKKPLRSLSEKTMQLPQYGNLKHPSSTRKQNEYMPLQKRALSEADTSVYTVPLTPELPVYTEPDITGSLYKSPSIGVQYKKKGPPVPERSQSLQRSFSLKAGREKSSHSPVIYKAPSSVNPRRKPVKVIDDLNGPFGVATNSLSQIIVSDSNKNRVLVLTPEGEKIFSFGKQGVKKGQFKRPCGIAVDQDDNIYVVDTNNHRVQKFGPEGKFVAQVGSLGNGKLQFAYPIGICFNETLHHLYVCDQANNRIQVLSTNLTLIRSFGEQGSENGQVNYPKSLAMDNSNNLYVTDCGNNRVQVFTADGTFVRQFSEKNEDFLMKPFAVAVDSKNSVFVSELSQHCVNVFTAEGEFVRSFGSRGSEVGEFTDVGCLCKYFNMIIVADSGNNRLQIF